MQFSGSFFRDNGTLGNQLCKYVYLVQGFDILKKLHTSGMVSKYVIFVHNFQIRDDGALCEYLCWLEKNFNTNINEAEAAEKLDKLRSEQDKFVSLSFETISSIGPNCAVIHYKPEMETAKVLSADMYLCDSGGQYL
ncbi:uncharacterized protein [Clytia hemisphaerica]|uniref:uncharacterized protein n=1 Tax=Clytia hemisphaerica TaxID=252671 RepID=UPI0034D47489